MYYPNYSSEGAHYADEQVNSERAVISLKAHSSEVSMLGYKPRADHGRATPPSEVSDTLSGRMPFLEVNVENAGLHFLSLNCSLLGTSHVCGPRIAGTGQEWVNLWEGGSLASAAALDLRGSPDLHSCTPAQGLNLQGQSLTWSLTLWWQQLAKNTFFMSVEAVFTK